MFRFEFEASEMGFSVERVVTGEEGGGGAASKKSMLEGRGGGCGAASGMLMLLEEAEGVAGLHQPRRWRLGWCSPSCRGHVVHV
jgi:hypothetical protein